MGVKRAEMVNAWGHVVVLIPDLRVVAFGS